MKKLIFVACATILLVGCLDKPADQEDVKAFFAKHKVGSSPDYAVVKNGTDYLLTVHGCMDDQSVCMSLIKPMNEDPSLSVIPGTFACVPLNH